MKEPVLQLPNYELPLEVHTDASYYAIGISEWTSDDL